MKRSTPKDEAGGKKNLRMFFIPCSCGASFAVAGDYDRRGCTSAASFPAPTAASVTTHAIGFWLSTTRMNASGKSAAA